MFQWVQIFHLCWMLYPSRDSTSCFIKMAILIWYCYSNVFYIYLWYFDCISYWNILALYIVHYLSPKIQYLLISKMAVFNWYSSCDLLYFILFNDTLITLAIDAFSPYTVHYFSPRMHNFTLIKSSSLNFVLWN